ncbi:ABC transporter substrate-binding protein [Shewanella sp. VB17]|uniref:ABC transporter substrate-binding protein n=1 Tax=Shewanella sp. VB17 TaxID=2739432 RepID=UPI0015635CB0|nr:ABC transporter substrate-binding protein [Shewanella sp. VB17]NRD72751.1 ABC transporter substrate-binding protein [Shewanella sp. VB17]
MFKIIGMFLLLSIPSLLHITALKAEEFIYIGLDADMSASAKEGGIAIKRGALLAINEINAAGGVLNKQLKLIIKDHRGNPARGVANIHAFAKQAGLVAVIGGVHTPVALQELPAIHQHQIIYLDPWAAGTPIIDNEFEPNFAFRVSVRDEQAGQVFLNYAAKLGMTKVGLLLERTGWGRSNKASMEKAASQLMMTISDIQWVNWGQKEMDAEVASLITSGAQAIVLVSNAPEAVVAAKAILSNPDSKMIPIISHWGIASGAFVNRLGLENLNKLNIVVLQSYSFDKPNNKMLNQSVLSQYQRTFDPSVTARSMAGAVGTAHAYDLVHLLVKAITDAQSLERKTVRDALVAIKDHQGLVKHYKPPFTEQMHDALLADDYFLSHFNELGQMIPIKE